MLFAGATAYVDVILGAGRSSSNSRSANSPAGCERQRSTAWAISSGMSSGWGSGVP